MAAKHASQTSNMQFGRDPSPPYQFRCTFEDKLDEENDLRQAREPNLKKDERHEIVARVSNETSYINNTIIVTVNSIYNLMKIH